MRFLRFAAGAGIMLAAACSSDSAAPENNPSFASSSALKDGLVSEKLAQINDSLAALGMNIAVQRAEFLLAPSAPVGAGQIVFANDRTKLFDTRWVPGDARRLADGNLITYMNFTPFMAANAAGNSESAIDASFSTWAGRKCAELSIVKRAWNGGNASVILSVDGVAAVSPFSADVFTLGFLPGSVFDLVLGAGASQSVVGVTFTFIFVTNPGGIPTDIDGDGRTDTALKEVWYNNAHAWTLTGLGSNIDVQTAALHENGHALELDHFGKIFATVPNGKLHVGTRAVMNAAILGTLRSPLGTDNAAYCENFETWPE